MSSNAAEKVHIHPVSFANVKGFLVTSKGSAILIDTGHTKTVGKFFNQIEKLGLNAFDLKLIILTHTHFDHAGGAAHIKKATGAPLAVHENEAEYLRRGCTPFPRGTRWKGKLMVGFGSVFARKMAWYPPVEPDLIIRDRLDLSPYGIQGEVVHTPGHTSGSVSVFIEPGVVIAGDNVLGISEKEHYPPFANDRAGVIRTWELYLERGVEKIYPAHGSLVYIKSIRDSIDAAREKYTS